MELNADMPSDGVAAILKTGTMDCDRIEAYAERLYRRGKLLTMTLAHLASSIHTQICRIKRENRSFRIEPNLLSALKDNLSDSFGKDFWEDKSQWILTRLDAWLTQGKPPEIPPGLVMSEPETDLPEEIADKEWYLRDLCAFFAAGELITKLDVFTLTAEKLEMLLTTRQKKDSVTEPPLFCKKPYTSIPTAVPMVSSIQAQLLKKERWKQDSNGVAHFQYKAKTNPNNYIEHFISTPGDITLLPWDEAQQIINKFGFNTVKLQLIFAAHTMRQDEPWKNSFTLEDSDIIKEMGWDRRTDLPLSQKLNELAKTAFVLDCLLVKATWVEGKSKKGIDASVQVSRMWNVLIDSRGQLNIEGKIDKPDKVYITVQPGLWTQAFLNKAGCEAKEALYQFGWIAQGILKIDPYHDELALRLAIYLTIDSRIRPSGKYEVEALLEAVLPKTIIELSRADRFHARNLKRRWDNTLNLLMALGWQIEFTETYPEWLRPNSNYRQHKGYFDILLRANIVIKPPKPIPEFVENKLNPKQPRKLKPDVAIELTGTQLRKCREARGWSQAKLASFLEISQKYLSLMERGDRTIPTKLEPQLRNLLDIQG